MKRIIEDIEKKSYEDPNVTVVDKDVKKRQSNSFDQSKDCKKEKVAFVFIYYTTYTVIY